MSEQKYIVKPKLRELLKESKFANQKEFASVVGVKEPTISRFDSQSRYDIQTLVLISRALNVTIDDLFIIEENPKFKSEMKLVAKANNKSDRNI
ncbi:helix-turn-helix transcriptional regulator [Niallia taxi]|uniref:helix-turn-helix domain-containing protein n=1 Tax=Niallia taxi TaxID=2499688 RepID=UPI003179F48A